MKTFSILIILFLASSTLFSQNIKNLELVSEESEVNISGTSSLHDWEEIAEDYSITGIVEGNQIIDLKIKIKTASIKSGKSIMDDKTYEALQEKKHPWIILEAKSLIIKNNKVSGLGMLSIAGKQNEISIETTAKEISEKQLVVTGSIPINMKNFGVDPPSAMFGTITTGEQVTISYKFKLMLK